MIFISSLRFPLSYLFKNGSGMEFGLDMQKIGFRERIASRFRLIKGTLASFDLCVEMI